MSAAQPPALATWHRLVQSQDAAGLRTLIADDAVFHSPVVHTPQRGKALVVATSADDEEMHAILEQATVADLIPRRTSSDDAGRSKPDPDIVHAALLRAGTPAAGICVTCVSSWAPAAMERM